MSPVAAAMPAFMPPATPVFRASATTVAPNWRPMSDASPPAEPLSTTTSWSAWSATEARHRCSHSVGRYDTTTTVLFMSEPPIPVEIRKER